MGKKQLKNIKRSLIPKPKVAWEHRHFKPNYSSKNYNRTITNRIRQKV